MQYIVKVKSRVFTEFYIVTADNRDDAERIIIEEGHASDKDVIDSRAAVSDTAVIYVGTDYHQF